MNYNDLVKSIISADLNRRRRLLRDMTPKELAAQIHPLNDYRNVMVAKQLLREKGVQGVPE